MARRKRAEKREVLPDPKYRSTLVAKFINCLMWDGKKTVAERILYDAFRLIEERTKTEPLKVFE